jgi:8-amino-7-oxononanoate synthase
MARKPDSLLRMDNYQSIQNDLDALDDDGLTRSLRTLGESGGKIDWKGKAYLNFSSNDYLNLANDARLKAGAIRAVEEFGCGATASRLMAGHLAIHEELEQTLADWLGMDRCLVFPSGFQANLGMVTSVADSTSVVYSDALNHASIVDGCRLSGARVEIYKHANADHLEELLNATQTTGRKLIVTDSVFSMDGDHAPLARISELAKQHNCLLAIDEAHALGVFGSGRGLCHALKISPDIIVGTMTKSFGSGGGFIASSASFQSLFINKARSFIFSTGLAPACAGSALAAIDVMKQKSDIGVELLRKSRLFRDRLLKNGVDIPDDDSQIIPIMIGSNAEAVRIMNTLLDQGILLAAVRPPSVPEGTARLRISVTLAHEDIDLEHAAKTIAKVLKSSEIHS